MKLERYELRAAQDLLTFQFTSEGVNGSIAKVVLFTRTDYPNLYNLAFGDRDEISGEINDTVVSNNGDSEKVLASVVSAVYAFTNINWDAWIYATGSTKARTRLYRIGISKFYNEVVKDFEIFGELDKGWQPFARNINYKAFLIKRKFAKFEL